MRQPQYLILSCFAIVMAHVDHKDQAMRQYQCGEEGRVRRKDGKYNLLKEKLGREYY